MCRERDITEKQQYLLHKTSSLCKSQLIKNIKKYYFYNLTKKLWGNVGDCGGKLLLLQRSPHAWILNKNACDF